MQKRLFTLLMLAGLSLQSKSVAETKIEKELQPVKTILTKGKQHFDVVSKNHKMIFHFTTDQEEGLGPIPTAGTISKQAKIAGSTAATPVEEFRVYILTPDNKRINGPKISMGGASGAVGRAGGSDPSRSAFDIEVKPPILAGTYTVVVKNISIPDAPFNLENNLIDDIITVTNSENTKFAILQIPDIENQTPADPGDTVQVQFVPTEAFFEHE